MRASFIYHQVSAIMSIIATVIVFYWLILGKNKDSYQTSLVILLLSLSWGVHAILHFCEEIWFDFNPLKTGKTTVYDEPVRV